METQTETQSQPEAARAPEMVRQEFEVFRPRTLADRKAAAMRDIPTIQKGGAMLLQGRQVPYMANDDLSEALRPILGAHGLSLRMNVNDVRKGLTSAVAVKMDVTLACPGEEETVIAYGEGATYAIAQTYAIKYWLMRTFVIGGGDADDELANAAHEDAAKMSGGRRERREKASQQRPPRRQDGEEETRSQNGNTREAPATSYRDDAGRRALMERLWDRLSDAFGVEAVTPDGTATGALDKRATQAAIRRELAALHRENPGMVALNGDGVPDATACSNDQLQRLVAWAESLGRSAPATDDDIPF